MYFNGKIVKGVYKGAVGTVSIPAGGNPPQDSDTPKPRKRAKKED